MRGKAIKHIRVGDLRIGQTEKKLVSQILESGRVSEGRFVREFELSWAKYNATRYCTVTSSGAGALMVSLAAVKHARKLSNDTKVITTPLTYIADSSAIVHVGFEPVFVDVEPRTFCITPRAVEEHLKRTRRLQDYAILLPVDLIGYPVDIEGFNRLARKYHLTVIEDAAQAHGSIRNGKRAGSQADMGIFSFYIAHNIQAGEMGAVITSNAHLYKLTKKLKAQGRSCDCPVCLRSEGKCPRLDFSEDDLDPRFAHDLIGYNFKAMEFQAALAIAQMRRISRIIKRRQENVKYLNQRLNKYKEIFQLPVYSERVSYLVYPLVIKHPRHISRKFLREELERRGVETRPLFGCIPTQQPAFNYLKSRYAGRLPNAEHAGRYGFYIGCHQYLTQEDLDYIVAVFDEVLG